MSAGGSAEQDLARVQAGGIPLAAEQRMAAMAAGQTAFTSDLSSADFALSRELGLRPLGQVMGCCTYQVGYQEQLGYGMGGLRSSGRLVMEIDTYSRAWNSARELAIGRLRQEAQMLGADAVIGVQLRANALRAGDLSASPAIEYSLIGTAIAHSGGTAGKGLDSAGPVLTELSVAEYSKLLRSGYQPLGIAAWSAVFYAQYGYRTAMQIQPGFIPTQESFELKEFSEAFYAAREQVMLRLGAQASALAATGVVGMRISHSMSRLAGAQGSGANASGLLVTFHALGTAIADAAPAATIPFQTVLRLNKP